jgi:hypothetical protein
MDQRVQIGIHDIGLSIVNDISREEMLYISLSKSKVVWTETRKSRARPLPNDINHRLEELYRDHVEQREANPDNRELLRKKYQLDDYRVCSTLCSSFIISSLIISRKSHSMVKLLN